jgi:uncharacterized RDD family membrane protein YckC
MTTNGIHLELLQALLLGVSIKDFLKLGLIHWMLVRKRQSY